MLVNGPIWTENVMRLGGVILAVLNKLDGYENIEPIRDHFNQAVREAKSVCTDPMNSKGFDPESYELAMRMADNKILDRIFMKIDSIDDVDKELANRILQILEPIYARSERTEKINCVNQKFLLHIR